MNKLIMTESELKINIKADLCHIEFWLEAGDLQTALFWLEKLKQNVANSEVEA